MIPWIAAFFSLFLLLVATKIVYTFLFSPLRKIPGPKWAALTDFWLLYRSLKWEGSKAVEECFKKHGDIVRIGPNTICVRRPEDVSQIYRGHQYLKHESVSRVRFSDIVNIAAAVDPKVHRYLRKMTNPLFANDSLKMLRQPMLETLENLQAQINNSIQDSQPIDMWRMYRLFAFDFIGYAAFGQPFDSLKTGEDNEFMVDLDRLVTMFAVKMALPPWLFTIIRKIPIPSWQIIQSAEFRIFDFGRQLVSKYNGTVNPDRFNMISCVFDSVDPETGEMHSERSVISTVCLYIVAASDTTSSAMSWITWALARHPHIYSRLRAELDVAIPDPRNLPDSSVLRRLPYLTAVVKEGLRRWPPTSLFLPRVVPRGGAVHQGYFIPENTTIGCNPYSMHRNEDFFPDPETYDPDRWLEVVDGVTKLKDASTMMAAYMPWSQGVRSCQGQPLAELEIFNVISFLVRRYKIKPDISSTDERMADIDLQVTTPKCHKILLKFEECL